MHIAKAASKHADLNRFLRDVAEPIAHIQQAELVGIYVFGSVSLDDYMPQSDVDLLVVTRGSISRVVKDRIWTEVSTVSKVYPSIGIDMIVTGLPCVTTLPERPTFEMSIAVGKEWKAEVEFGGDYEAILLDLEIARRCGLTLVGPSAVDLIAPVPFERLMPIVRETIDWHRRKLFDPFHDPLGHYAVLNTCRALRYAEESVLSSKTDAAAWARQRFPQYDVIAKATEIRLGNSYEPLDRIAIEDFLAEASSKIDARST